MGDHFSGHSGEVPAIKSWAITLTEYLVGDDHTAGPRAGTRQWMLMIPEASDYKKATDRVVSLAKRMQTAMTYRWRVEIVLAEHVEGREPCCQWITDSILSDKATERFRRKWRDIHRTAASLN